jgi:hypothetical protein
MHWVIDVEHQLELSWNGHSPESFREMEQAEAALFSEPNVAQLPSSTDSPSDLSQWEMPEYNAEATIIDLSEPPHSPTDVNDLSPSESQRTRQLEQALYQCQLYIDELKQKLINQSFLEEQLAATEAFSHVQKQAIETLKAQVSEQRAASLEVEALKKQLEEAQSAQKVAEAIAQQQETEVSMLKLKVLQGQSEVQRIRDKNEQMLAQQEALQSSMVQETQQRIIAQKTAERLRTDQRNRNTMLQELERRIRQTEEMLTHREKIISAIQDKHQPDSQKNQFIQELSTTLLQAQKRIAALEEDIANHTIVQAQLQHTVQEFEQETQQSQVRSDAMDHQVAELQEQVLRQAQQASEYETAIQHWKNRSLEAEEWVAEVAKTWESINNKSGLSTDEKFSQLQMALQRWIDSAQRKAGLPSSQDLTPHELLGLRPRPPGYYGT